MSKGFTKKEAKISAILVGIILTEKVLSFAKNVVFAYFFGAKNSTDLYYLATNIVSLFNLCFCVSIPMAFLTVFINKGLREAEPKEQEKVMSNTISAFLVIAAIFTTVLFFTAPILERIIAPTISTDPNERLSVYVQVLSFIVILYCLSGLFSSSLECLENYIPSKLSSLFVSFAGMMAAVLFGRKYGTVIAVYGFLAGIGCHAMFSFFLLRRRRKVRVRKPQYDDNVKAILKLSLPMMASVAVTSINSLVDKLIAVRIGEGVVSALNYSSLLSRELVTGVLVASVSSIVTARFSENILYKEFDALNKNINVVIYIMSLAVVPLTIFYLTAARGIIGLVFERGAFDTAARNLTVVSFIGYSFGLIFLPFREVFIRIQYAYQDSKNPMKISIISVIVNILLSVILGFYFGIIGVSIATSIATVINCVLSYFSIRRAKVVDMKIDWIMFVKLMVNGIVMYALSMVICRVICTDTFTGLAIVGLLVFGSFILLSYITNRRMFNSALSQLKCRRG